MDAINHGKRLPNPADVSFLPTALRWGLIGGLISIVIGLVANVTGVSTLEHGWILPLLMMPVIFGVVIYALVMAIRTHRDDELGGAITLGRAFTVAFVAALIMTVLGFIFNYLYLSVIDPDMPNELMRNMEDMFENMGLPEEAIEEQLAANEGRFTMKAQLMQSFVWGPVIYAIISLICAAIMKRDPAPHV